MKNSVFIPLLFLLVSSCNHPEKEENPLFTLLSPADTHVDFINRLTEDEQFNMIEYLYFNNGGGVAAGDINNDGLADLFFTSNQQSNKLFLNKGNFVFEDITDRAMPADQGDWKSGVTQADVNGDGFLDIYVCQVGNYKGLQGRNQLFINHGDLTFEEKGSDYGLDFQGFSTQAAFFDYDSDGDLDMYLLNHSVHTSRSYGGVDLRLDQDDRAGDRLYRNDETKEGRVFRDVTEQSGIYSSQIGYGLGVRICDINNDGFPDIYISNDFHENDYLYINNGDATFSERLTEMMAHTSRSSMGNDVGDINNDGDLDVIVLDMLPDNQEILKQSGGEDDYELFKIKRKYGYNHQYVRNTLQLNLGGVMFSEIGRLAGIYATDWSWSPLLCDVDNDGWKDLLITNGIYRRANDLDYIRFLTGGNRNNPVKDLSGVPDKVLYEKMPLYPNFNYLYKNNGDLTFTNMAQQWGFDTRSYSNGSACADLDNDGDLDFVANNINAGAYIFRNNAESLLDNHYLSVALKGEGLNTLAVGARITLFCNGQEMVAEQFATRGFLSSTTHVLHMGLGQARVVDSLVVRWPDRTEQRLYDVTADREITLEKENAGSPATGAGPAGENTVLFTRVHIPGLEYTHMEDAYSDMNRERLIPHNLSAEGPAVAAGDVDGNGLEDLFVGGATGQAAVLLTQQPDGSFTRVPVPVFREDRFAEDVDAAFFDADGDGDTDLYIVRGGNSVPTGNPRLADRLLINNGKGLFSPCETGSLPDLAYNGSCVRPADFDQDGDLDLFVGSRSVPGAYGLPPDQLLLENNGEGRFQVVTNHWMKGLEKVGMVTDAQWVDHEPDGDPDLVLVGEWMQVQVLRNDAGSFTDITRETGLEETSGWWNCIEAHDVDMDGDVDLVAGNLGLNSMLKATGREPVEMYVSDFDNNGSMDQVICSYDKGISYPIASLDELATQINGLKNRYPRYSDFSGKSAEEIFGQDKLDQSVYLKASLLQSCLFLNRGDGTFETVRLPLTSQFSPVRDIWIHDVNSDGRCDLVLAGNNYTIRPSLGRYDAGYGWCLVVDSAFTYKALMPQESGLRIDGDARRIIPMEVNGMHLLLAFINDGELQLFRYF